MLSISKILIIIFLIHLELVYGQDSTNQQGGEDFQKRYIKLILQYPESEEIVKDKFGEKLVKVLFGEEENNPIVKPVSIIAKDTGNYWIIDQGTGKIVNVKNKVGEIAQYKNKEYKIFPSLVGSCFIKGDSLLFTDSYLNKIFILIPHKKSLQVLNDSLILNRPTGIAYNPVNQQIYVVETTGHCISVLDMHGNFVRKIGQRGEEQGEFNFPNYIWIDKFGKIFIVDSMNFRIQIFSPDGQLISVFGKIGDATGSFARPRGIATDSDGNIYIVDALFNTVQIFNHQGQYLYNFGLQGRERGNFWLPAGIFIDENDFIYVADSYNSRIQVFKYIKSSTN